MLLGGFYHVDLKLSAAEPQKEDFALRCDTASGYSRKWYTNNGRTATVHALNGSAPLTAEDVILVPDYLCVSVLNALEVSGAKFRFYRVKKDLTIDLEDLRSKMDDDVKIIYVIHYFGIPQPEEVRKTVLELKAKYGAMVLEDLTQTLYTKHEGRIGFGDFLVASTRKWTPVTDGGIVAARNGQPFEDHPLGNAYDEAVYKQLLISIFRDYYDQHPDEDISYYLQLEKEANAARYLDFTPKKMTDLSRRVFFNFDHEESRSKRIRNYNFLMEKLSGVPGIELLAKPLDGNGDYVPFGFPLMVEERDKVYRYLADHGVIGEIQWILPVQYYTPGEDAQYMSDHNIMLQCDQRYSLNEMQNIVDIIKNYMEANK